MVNIKILIDADGCPVVKLTLEIAERYGLEAVVIADTSHEFKNISAQVITVDKGADSADYKVANLAQKGDIAVTQDYGLAAMVLAKKASAIRQDGLVYDDDNISALLSARHTAAKIRRSGGRLKGQKKRTADEDKLFAESLCRLIETIVSA